MPGFVQIDGATACGGTNYASPSRTECAVAAERYFPGGAFNAPVESNDAPYGCFSKVDASYSEQLTNPDGSTTTVQSDDSNPLVYFRTPPAEQGTCSPTKISDFATHQAVCSQQDDGGDLVPDPEWTADNNKHGSNCYRAIDGVLDWAVVELILGKGMETHQPGRTLSLVGRGRGR